MGIHRWLIVTRPTAVTLAIMLAWCCFIVMAIPVAAAGPELAANGGMEDGDPPTRYSANDAALSASKDAHSGKQSLSIVPSVNLGRAVQTVPVKAGTTYRFTFWYKCVPGGGQYFYVHLNEMGRILYADAKNDTTWTRWTATFEVPKEATASAAVALGFCGWPDKEILIDDFSVAEVLPGDIETPADEKPTTEVSPDAVRAAEEEARKQVESQWRAKFAGRDYLCWAKSPWERLSQAAAPPASIKELKTMNLAMGGNEYESASFVLTNFSGKTAAFSVSVKPGSIPVTLRQAVWITSFSGTKVNDALPLLDGKISIPSGESREIWLTLYSRGVKPGDYRTEVAVSAQGLGNSIVNLKTKVYSVSLPDDKPIYTSYWDFVVPSWTTPEMARALVNDMKEHYVTAPTVHPWPVRLQVNPDGTLKEDYKDLDEVLDAYRVLKPKIITFFWNPDSYLENIPGYEFFGEKWKGLFKQYLTGMVSHLREKGWDYSKFAIQPYDERLDAKVLQMAKLIKEIDPKILILVNATGTPDEIRNIAPYVDIFMPHYSNYAYSASAEARELSAKLLPKSRDFFWTYTNCVPPFPQESSPYADYRLAVWRAWEQGMGGFGYFTYFYKAHWNSYKHQEGENWSVVYDAKAEDAPAGLSKRELVVTGKRWEATREGVEDYVYLRLLKDKLEKAKGKVSPELLSQAQGVLADGPKSVLADPKNASLADAAKEKMLKVLSRFPKGK